MNAPQEEGTVKPEDDGKPKADGEEEGDGGSKALPSLPGYDKRISELKDIALEIKEMESTISEGWLKIDAKPIKTALGKTVCLRGAKVPPEGVAWCV